MWSWVRSRGGEDQVDRKIIDIHAHILPGVDDGSRTMEESCRLLEKAYEQGVRAIIATPHSHHTHGREYMEQLITQLSGKTKKNTPDLQLYLGQEIMYSESVAEQLQKGQLWPMAGSRYVLLEFLPAVSYRTLFRGIRQMRDAGYLPVLAHMERYSCLRQKENLLDLSGSGCVLQMNYDSLQGSSLNPNIRWCRKRVQAGEVQVLASDMHRMDYRPPELRAAFRWLEDHVEEALIKAMTDTNPAGIIGHLQ